MAHAAELIAVCTGKNFDLRISQGPVVDPHFIEPRVRKTACSLGGPQQDGIGIGEKVPRIGDGRSKLTVQVDRLPCPVQCGGNVMPPSVGSQGGGGGGKVRPLIERKSLSSDVPLKGEGPAFLEKRGPVHAHPALEPHPECRRPGTMPVEERIVTQTHIGSVRPVQIHDILLTNGIVQYHGVAEGNRVEMVGGRVLEVAREAVARHKTLLRLCVRHPKEHRETEERNQMPCESTFCNHDS